MSDNITEISITKIISDATVGCTRSHIQEKFVDITKSYIKKVLEARDWIIYQLQKDQIKYHSEGGNFILIWPNKPTNFIDDYLRSKKILIGNQKFL